MQILLVWLYLIVIAAAGAQAPTLWAAAKSEKATKPPPATAEDDEEEDDSDYQPDGDPYPRYMKAANKDQACDPTLLAAFYRKYAKLKCVISAGGFCIEPGLAEVDWMAYSALTGGITGSSVALASQREAIKHASRAAQEKAEREAVLSWMKTMDEVMSKTIVLTEEQSAKLALARNVGESNLRRSALLLEKEVPAVAKSTGRLVLWTAGRGAVIGTILGAATGGLSLAIDFTLTPTPAGSKCDDENAQDPDFRQYVPLEKDSCQQPDYNFGAPASACLSQTAVGRKTEEIEQPAHLRLLAQHERRDRQASDRNRRQLDPRKGSL